VLKVSIPLSEDENRAVRLADALKRIAQLESGLAAKNEEIKRLGDRLEDVEKRVPKGVS
jgi:hypothetical protein